MDMDIRLNLSLFQAFAPSPQSPRLSFTRHSSRFARLFASLPHYPNAWNRLLNLRWRSQAKRYRCIFLQYFSEPVGWVKMQMTMYSECTAMLHTKIPNNITDWLPNVFFPEMITWNRFWRSRAVTWNKTTIDCFCGLTKLHNFKRSYLAICEDISCHV